MWWVVGAAPHGAWLGILERCKLEHFLGNLSDGMTVWDIGANVGLYTLSSARIITSSANVYAFEPLPRNLNYLYKHITYNRLTNVIVIPAAVDETEGAIQMSEGDSPSEFHADPNGNFKVPTIALDTWRKKTNSPVPQLVKIDVEGAEAAVLRGGAQTFSEHRPLIYLALHGESQRQECRDLLLKWGYNLNSLEDEQNLDLSSEWLAEPII
jgi:FkbM family methyltransferase